MSKYLPINLFIRQALLYPLTAPFLPGVADVKDGVKYAAGKLEGEYEGGVAGGLPFTGQVTQIAGGDDGTHQKGHTLTRPIVKGAEGNTRFTDNDDGTITDAATGLMWIKDPINNPAGAWATRRNWITALNSCNNLVFATHSDWRMPNIKELMSIVDFGYSTPSIDPIFTGCDTSYYYYSSTSKFGGTTSAFAIRFSTPLMLAAGKTNLMWCRPVRLGLPE